MKSPPAEQETRVQSPGGEEPLEDMATTPVFFPGESHGQRSLVGGGLQSMGSQRVGLDSATQPQSTITAAKGQVALAFLRVINSLRLKRGRLGGGGVDLFRNYFCAKVLPC